MSTYASGTTVPIERTRAEIEGTLRRYGADQFFSGWDGDKAMISFRAKGRFIRFVLVLPAKDEKRFTEKVHKGRHWPVKLSADASAKAWDAEVRRMWRSLLLAIKAKLEVVESGISSFEDEFLAYIVLPDQTLVGDRIRTYIQTAYETGKMPLLGDGGGA